MIEKDPHCPECKQIKPVRIYETRASTDDGMVTLLVLYCLQCGCILGAASPHAVSRVPPSVV